jgi:hypothetical protein
MPTLSPFQGLLPRVPEHARPPGTASVATDCDLRTGSVRPWREPLDVGYPEEGTVTCRLEGGRLFAWPVCVEHTSYLADYGRLFVTGRNVRPEVADIDGDPLEYEFLGVPAPANAPQASGPEEFGEESDARSYVYTYVNRREEESAPSLPSRELTVKDGTTIVLRDILPPPDGWGIVAVDIYRSASGVRKSVEDMQAPASVWLRAGRVPAGTTEFRDSVMLKNLGQSLETEDARVPPPLLRNVTHLEGTGALCGTDGCRLHFSENFQPWNWPVEHDMTFPHGIVNMRALGSWVFLSTSAKAYVVDGAPPCSDSLNTRKVQETREEIPDLGCGRPHSATMTPFGMVFSSPLGLALVQADSSIKILTALWYTQDQWSRLGPDTARMAYWRGMIFCVTDEVSLVLEIEPALYADGESGTLTMISDRPDDIWTTCSGELMMLENGTVRQWNAGKAWREFDWQSADLRFQGKLSPTWAKVRTEGAFMRLSPGGRVPPTWSPEIFVSGDAPFRLPRMGRHDSYRVRLTGTGPVESVSLDVTAFAAREETPWPRSSL